MIASYQRRAAKLAALAACADDPKERRRLEQEKQICEEMICILQNIHNKYKEKNI